MLWCCTWGRGPEGAMAPTSLSSGFQSFTLIPIIKLGPSGAGSRVGGPVHTLGPCGSLQGPLLWGWESLLLLPQPPRAFSIKGLRLPPPPPSCSPGLLGLLRSPPFVRFIYVRMWGCGVLPALCLPSSLPLRVRPSRFIFENVWPQGLLVVRLPAPFIPHPASLSPATAMRVISTPVPISAPPTSLDVCFFFIYLVSDFPAIRFSVSSGCARRRSVSTYTAILVLLDLLLLTEVQKDIEWKVDLSALPDLQSPSLPSQRQLLLVVLCVQKSQLKRCIPNVYYNITHSGYKSTCISNPIFLLPNGRIDKRLSFRSSSLPASTKYSSTFIHYVFLERYIKQNIRLTFQGKLRDLKVTTKSFNFT